MIFSNPPGKKKQIKVTKSLATMRPGSKPDTSGDGVTMNFQRGKETKTYTPGSVETGHPDYGKIGTGKSVQGLLDKGRASKIDVVHDSQGKSFRAGYTSITKTPDKLSADVKTTPNFGAIYETQYKATPDGNINQKFGKPMKRRLPRVAWLKGRNPRTESGYGS